MTLITMKETIIYLRTSTEEQHPENQLKDCLEILNKLNIKQYEVFQEQQSAWKDLERPVFNSICDALKKGEVKNFIVWDFDRIYRHRKRTVEFIRNYSKLGLRVYSFRQSWIEQFNSMPEPWNEIMSELMLNIVSWMAEDESRKKSERVRNAIRKDNGVTKSCNGNRWGRRSVVNERIIEEVLKLSSEGKKVREISKQVYYYDENRNKKPISKSLVHKIITKNGTQNNS